MCAVLDILLRMCAVLDILLRERAMLRKLIYYNLLISKHMMSWPATAQSRSIMQSIDRDPLIATHCGYWHTTPAYVMLQKTL